MSITGDKEKKNKHKVVLIFLFIILGLLQITSTTRQDLFEITNDDKRAQQEKLDSYPPVRITLGNKTLWIPADYWFEGRTEYLAFYRFKENLFENLDLNNFFFASSPRPRVGMDEFEKLPYVFLPFFVYGTYLLLKNKPEITIFSIIPLLLMLALIGNQSHPGPFALFPFIATATAVGVRPLFESKKKKYLILLLFITLLIYIQIYSYENFI